MSKADRSRVGMPAMTPAPDGSPFDMMAKTPMPERSRVGMPATTPALDGSPFDMMVRTPYARTLACRDDGDDPPCPVVPLWRCS